MPVKVRTATQHNAMFSVDADAAQRLIDYSGLQVCRFLSSRALVVLMLMHFEDTDLGQYYEYSTYVMVNPPGSPASGLGALQSAGAFCHHMPVDQAFTLEAGRTIWGYPKVMADFTVRDGRQFGFDVTSTANLPSVWISGPVCRCRPDLPPASRCIPPTRISTASRAKPRVSWCFPVFVPAGGVDVRLGEHPYAKELASLGLPKRALVSSSAANVEMTFGDAQEISH